jgi:hypothetical protein
MKNKNNSDEHRPKVIRSENRVPPAKARKSCVVPIRGYPFGAGLYSQSGEINIRNQVATCVHRRAETGEYFPMAWAWNNRSAVGPISYLRYKVKSCLERRGLMEDTWMCYNSEEAGQHKIRHTIGCVAVNDACQPFSITLMISRVTPMGVNKDVNVDENQGRPP